MKQVASLRYDVIFKKAFQVPAIFTALVRDFLNIELEIDNVETDKVYDPPIGNVAVKFDLYAEDKNNRVIVDIQHVRFLDHYHRFLHYHCADLLNQLVHSKDYRPPLKIFTLVILTSGDRHQQDISIIDFDPKNLQGEPLGEIGHKIIYICPKYLNKTHTPRAYHEWMEAIEDSLDEQVDESHYTHPQIQAIFKLIEKDQVTPQERAKMFDEYSLEEVKKEQLREIRAAAMAEGRAEGEAEGEAKGKVAGLKEGERKAREEQQQSVRRLLSLEVLTEEQIAQAMGLSVEEVKVLTKAK